MKRNHISLLIMLYSLPFLLCSSCQQPRKDKQVDISKNKVSNVDIEDQSETNGSVYSDSMIRVLSQNKKSIDPNAVNPSELFSNIISKTIVCDLSHFDIKSLDDVNRQLLTEEEKVYIYGTHLLGKIEGEIDTSIVILNISGESHFGTSIELVRYNPSKKEFSKQLLSVEYLSENQEWYLSSKMVGTHKIRSTKVIRSKEFDERGIFTGQILQDTLIEEISL